MALPRIELVVFDGFDEIDIFGPFEVLSAAGFETALVAVEKPGAVVSMRGLQLTIPEVIGAPHGIIVPGGGWLDGAPEGARAQVERGTLGARLNEVAPQAAWVASVCTGAMVLAAAGLLTDRFATTNRAAYDDLKPFVRGVIDERVVDDGDRITSGALTSGIDLGIWITERELGSAAADAVAQEIEHVRHGRVWHAPGRPA